LRLLVCGCGEPLARGRWKSLRAQCAGGNKSKQKSVRFTAGLPDRFGQFYRLKFKFHFRNRWKSGLVLPGGGEMKTMLSRFFADQSAATAIEYGLIAAGISLAIIAAVNGLGTTLNNSYTSINNSLK
jgi:pilus assembly protein Flp/PilA